MKERNGLSFLFLLSLLSTAGGRGTAGAALWEPVGLGGGGGMQAPSISPHDPRFMFVRCDMGQTFRTEDGGRNWRLIPWRQLTFHNFCRPVFHPADPGTVFAIDKFFYRYTLKVSHDRGVTWRPLAKRPPWPEKEKLWTVAVDPDNGDFLLVGTAHGAYASADGGKSWWKCRGLDGNVVGFHVDRTSPKAKRVCIAAGGKGVFRSDDGGKTWRPKVRGLPADRWVRKKGEVYALDWSRIAFKYPSLAGGSNPKTGKAVLYVVLPSRLKHGRLIGGVYRSLDRGGHWASAMGRGINKDTPKTEGASAVAQYSFVLTTDAKPRTVYVACTASGEKPPHHMTVYRSDDAGGTWRAVFYSEPSFKKFNVEYDYQSLTLNHNDQDPPRGLSICPSNPEIVVLSHDDYLYRTSDGGKSWKALHCRRATLRAASPWDQDWHNNGMAVTAVWNYYFDPFDPKRHYAAYGDIAIARSLDAGKTWRWGARGLPREWNNNMGEIALDPGVPGRLWGGFNSAGVKCIFRNQIGPRSFPKGRGGIALSDDYGDHWRPCMKGLPENAAVSSIVLDPASPKNRRVLYASVLGKGVYRSADEGQSWTLKSRGLGFGAKPLLVFKLLRHGSGALFALISGLQKSGEFQAARSGGAGLYRSVDEGEHWRLISASLPSRWIPDFAVHPRDARIIYATSRRTPHAGSGVFKTTDGGENWTLLLRKGPEHFGVSIHPKKPDWVYATLAEDNPGDPLWLSKDGGKTWKALASFPFVNALGVFFDPRDEEHIYVGTWGASVLRGPAEPEGN